MVQPPPPSPPPFIPPPPQPPSWGSPGWTVQRSSASLVGLAIGAVVVAVFFMIFIPVLVMTGGSLTFMFAPICAVFVILMIILIAAAAQGSHRPQLPPPPPIQQPMVPAGMQGPVALSCPNCGAPPSVVDRFGVATCPYCNTRYLVR